MNSTDDISDKELSDLYHDASRERSPASLDKAVLELAREHVQMHNTNTRLRKLTPRFAWAAVIVLSIGVILSIQFDNSGENLDVSDYKSPPPQQPANVESESEPEPTRNEIAKQSLPVAKLREKYSAKEKIVAKAKKRPAPKQEQQNTAVAESEASQPSAPPLAEQPQGTLAFGPFSGDALSDSNRERDSPSVATGSASSSGARARLSLPPPPVETTTTAKAAAPAPKPAPKPAPQVSSTAPPPERKASPTPENISAFSRPQATLKNKALDESRLKAPAATVCNDLSPYACAVSTQCILTKSEHGLSCRSAANRCEFAFNQLESSKSTCEGFGGCRYIDGDCECNKESEQCVCKSKGPALCQPIE